MNLEELLAYGLFYEVDFYTHKYSPLQNVDHVNIWYTSITDRTDRGQLYKESEDEVFCDVLTYNKDLDGKIFVDEIGPCLIKLETADYTLDMFLITFSRF